MPLTPTYRVLIFPQYDFLLRGLHARILRQHYDRYQDHAGYRAVDPRAHARDGLLRRKDAHRLTHGQAH